jgi:hypothetical protein
MPKPEPSEWGKVSAGQSYGLLATDFGRALFAGGWGRYELIIIGFLMEQCWGAAMKSRIDLSDWPDPVPCRFNLSALSKEWGIPSQRLYEARAALIAKRFAVESEDGLWINKDAHEWVDPKTGGQLIPDVLLDYAESSRTRRKRRDKQASYTENRGNGLESTRKTVETAWRVHGKPWKRSIVNACPRPHARTRN